MDNIQFWIWLVVIVVTLITRFRKKPVDVPRSKTTRPVPHEDDGTKPLTFEELLKEIEASRKPELKPIQPVTSRKPVNYDDNLGEEGGKYLEQSTETYEIYENAKREAFYRPSLEETLKLEDTIVRFDQFSKYKKEQRPSLAAQFASELRTPGGFKKAFIMSEILSRRY